MVVAGESDVNNNYILTFLGGDPRITQQSFLQALEGTKDTDHTSKQSIGASAMAGDDLIQGYDPPFSYACQGQSGVTLPQREGDILSSSSPLLRYLSWRQHSRFGAGEIVR